MDSRYDRSAERLAQQKKQRMRVIKRRRKVAETIGAGVLVVALSVGMSFMFAKGWDREFEANQQMIAEFRAENYRPEISQEDIEQANKEYVEDHYSAETIEGLKGSVISEYGVLIDAIVENEKLQVNSDVEPLDSNRLDKAITEYGNFKTECEKDEVNYAEASEKDRIDESTMLYNKKLSVLEKQLTEATQKSNYLVVNSSEYVQNQKEIEEIGRKINTAKIALDVVADRSMTIYFEAQNALEGKQR